jgi:hypothetical protein
MPTEQDKKKRCFEDPRCLGRSPPDPSLLLVGFAKIKKERKRENKARVFMADFQFQI